MENEQPRQCVTENAEGKATGIDNQTRIFNGDQIHTVLKQFSIMEDIVPHVPKKGYVAISGVANGRYYLHLVGRGQGCC